MYLTEATVGSTTLNAILTVFKAVGVFIVEMMQTLLGMFYDGDGLTLLGNLAIIGLAFGVAFVLINIIRGFLHVRG